MSITSRLKNMLQADAHAVLDSIEDPSALLKQSIREMKNEILKSDAELRAFEISIDKHNKTLLELSEQSSLIESELDLCLADENDSLAKQVIKRKLRTQSQTSQIKNKLVEINKCLVIKKEEVIAQQEKLEATQLQVNSIPSSNCSHHYEASKVSIISEAEIEIALLSAKQERRA